MFLNIIIAIAVCPVFISAGVTAHLAPACSPDPTYTSAFATFTLFPLDNFRSFAGKTRLFRPVVVFRCIVFIHSAI